MCDLLSIYTVIAAVMAIHLASSSDILVAPKRYHTQQIAAVQIPI